MLEHSTEKTDAPNNFSLFNVDYHLNNLKFRSAQNPILFYIPLLFSLHMFYFALSSAHLDFFEYLEHMRAPLLTKKGLRGQVNSRISKIELSVQTL